MHRALAALGDPHKKLPPIIHVAGTNGKGSTIAFLRAIAESASKIVHAFTKPHLIALNERFVVAGEVVSDDALVAAAERVASTGESLTQFEAQAAAAFLLFSETPADLVLLETGMGGRDDATNVIARSAASVITPIALDHQDVLGATLTDIARHKAGIIKPSTPVVTARQREDALHIIEAEAAKQNAPLYLQGRDWDAYPQYGRFVVLTESRSIDLPQPALAGAHQIDNAGVAVAAILYANPFPRTDTDIERGIARVHWPARLQHLSNGPIAEPILNIGGEVWIDGGHNAHAAAALAHWAQIRSVKRPAPLVLIIAMRARKDWRALIDTLAPHAARIIAIDLGADFVPAQDIAAHVNGETAPDLLSAIKNAAQLPAPRILICGSLALAGKALQEL